MDAHNLKQRYMRLTAAHGVAMMLAGCLWGMLPRPAAVDLAAGAAGGQPGWGHGDSGVTPAGPGTAAAKAGGPALAALLHAPIQHDKAFLAAHHQFTHQAEFTLALAFAWPLLKVNSPAVLRFLLVTTLAGMWLNPLAYVLMAVMGQGTPLAPTVSAGLPTTAAGTGTWWSSVVTAMFVTVGAADVTALALWLYGLARA